MNVFNNISCDYAVRNYDCTFSNETGLAYIPENIVMFDVDSATDYFVVVIDDVIELRQSDVIVEKGAVDLNVVLDCSTPIHDQEIIEKMETGDITLDKSFELYKNGLEEIKAANAMLETIEKAMLVMNEDGSLEEF